MEIAIFFIGMVVGCIVYAIDSEKSTGYISSNDDLQEENTRLLNENSRLNDNVDEVMRNANNLVNRYEVEINELKSKLRKHYSEADNYHAEKYVALAEEKVRDKITKITDQRNMYKHRLEQLTGVKE